MREDGVSGTGLAEDRSALKTGRGTLMQLLRLAVAVAILAYLFSAIPAAQVLAILRRAEVSWLVVAFLLSLLVQLVTAMRMKILADAHCLGLTAFEIFEINLVTRFYGLFLPGGSFTAIAVRIFKLVQVRRHYAGAITAVTFDRLTATLMMCVVGIVCWTLAWTPGQVGWLLVMIAALLGLAIPFIWLYGRPLDLVDPERATVRWSRSRFRSVGLAVSEARSMPSRALAWVLGWSVLAHLFGIVEYVALARSLDLEVGVFALGWIRTAMLMAALIPISLSGLGLREGAALLALPVYGVGLDAALAYSLLVFAVSHLAVGLVGGLFEMVGFLLARRA